MRKVVLGWVCSLLPPGGMLQGSPSPWEGWRKGRYPGKDHLLAAMLANRHRNLQRWSREEDKPPQNLLFSVGSSRLSMLGPSTPGRGSGWQGAVVKAGVSLLLAVL